MSTSKWRWWWWWWWWWWWRTVQFCEPSRLRWFTQQGAHHGSCYDHGDAQILVHQTLLPKCPTKLPSLQGKIHFLNTRSIFNFNWIHAVQVHSVILLEDDGRLIFVDVQESKPCYSFSPCGDVQCDQGPCPSTTSLCASMSGIATLPCPVAAKESLLKILGVGK